MPMPILFGLTISSERAWWLLLCFVVFVTYFCLKWLVLSHVGRSWIVSRDSPGVASSLGISIFRSRVSAFALSSFVAGIAGALHGYYIGTVQITNYTLHLSVVFVTIVVLGGPGRLIGAIWAAMLVTALPHVLSWGLRSGGVDVIAGGAGSENIVLGFILALVLLKAPQRFNALLRRKTNHDK
jgi:branched-chain amino acid transport system permease protein